MGWEVGPVLLHIETVGNRAYVKPYNCDSLVPWPLHVSRVGIAEVVAMIDEHIHDHMGQTLVST